MKPIKPIFFFLFMCLCFGAYAGEQPAKKPASSKGMKPASDNEILKKDNGVQLPALSYYNRGVTNLADKNTEFFKSTGIKPTTSITTRKKPP